MNDKNIILNNYCGSISSTVVNLATCISGLTPENETVNDSIVKTANIILETLRSQIIIFQQELDNYKGVI